MNSLLERDGYVVKRNFFNNDATSVLNLYSFKSIQDQISVPGCPRDEVEHENSWNLNSHAAFDSILFTSTREMIEIDLQPGDALIYKGIEQKHYRKLFTGNWYSQLFLHWVDTTQTDWFYDCKSTPSEIEKKYTDSWESILYKSS